MKSECPTFLRSKGKDMAITLSDDEVSDHESESIQEGNFMAFTTTSVVVNFMAFTAKNFRNFLRNNNRRV